MTPLEHLKATASQIGNFRNDIGACSVCGGRWLSVAHLSWSNYGHCLRCMDCWALGPRRRSAKRAAQLHGRMWQVTHGKRIQQVYRRKP